jgi:hypothetical protein
MRTDNGRKVRRVKVKSLLNSKRLSDATEKLRLRVITTIEFLTLTSHIAEKIADQQLAGNEQQQQQQQQKQQQQQQKRQQQQAVYDDSILNFVFLSNLKFFLKICIRGFSEVYMFIRILKIKMK